MQGTSGMRNGCHLVFSLGGPGRQITFDHRTQQGGTLIITFQAAHVRQTLYHCGAVSQTGQGGANTAPAKWQRPKAVVGIVTFNSEIGKGWPSDISLTTCEGRKVILAHQSAIYNWLGYGDDNGKMGGENDLHSGMTNDLNA